MNLWWISGGILGLGAIWVSQQWRKNHELAKQSLFEAEPEFDDFVPRQVVTRKSWHTPIVYIIGILLLVSLAKFFGLDLLLGGAIAVVVMAIAWVVVDVYLARRDLLIESQLADAIDLIVSALRAGTSVAESVQRAVREARAPLRDALDEVSVRLRIGDDPSRVFVDLSKDLPLEGVRLFALSMAVHWEVGGSLAPTLSSVGRSIRDRIDVARRVTAQAAEAQFSVIFVLLITYGVALLMWKSNPERVADFVTSEVGRYLVTIAALLQACGVIWMLRLSRVRY